MAGRGEEVSLVAVAVFMSHNKVLDAVIRIPRPGNKMIDLSLDRFRNTVFTVEAVATLNLPETSPDPGALNALRAEQKILQPALGQLIYARDHRSPFLVNQGAQQAVELNQVIGHPGLEADVIVKMLPEVFIAN